MEFTADMRLMADSLLTIEAIEAIGPLITAADRERFSARTKRWAEVVNRRRSARSRREGGLAGRPIDRRWLSYQIGQALGDNCIIFDDTIVLNQVHPYLQDIRPGSYFYNPSSSGGWAPGAAFGAKLAAPDRIAVAITGDGEMMSQEMYIITIASSMTAEPALKCKAAFRSDRPRCHYHRWNRLDWAARCGGKPWLKKWRKPGLMREKRTLRRRPRTIWKKSRASALWLMACDVKDQASVEQLVAATVAEFKKIDILIYNVRYFLGAFPRKK